jgi:hypothetical protein
MPAVGFYANFLNPCYTFKLVMDNLNSMFDEQRARFMAQIQEVMMIDGVPNIWQDGYNPTEGERRLEAESHIVLCPECKKPFCNAYFYLCGNCLDEMEARNKGIKNTKRRLNEKNAHGYSTPDRY